MGDTFVKILIVEYAVIAIAYACQRDWGEGVVFYGCDSVELWCVDDEMKRNQVISTEKISLKELKRRAKKGIYRLKDVNYFLKEVK